MARIKVLVFKHLTVTSIRSGTNTSLTQFVRISLWMFPSYSPWQPAFASVQISGCWQPSKVAHWKDENPFHCQQGGFKG